jgi:nicotinamide-nucleotide amidase
VDQPSAERRLLTAELLSIGTELTVGETRDTNAGELAHSLTEAGVTVMRITALPDRLDVVTAAFGDALRRSDLVISTGGLGPTPDDLTRESIAAVVDEAPTVDPALEAWLRELWARREMPFPEINLKQAWRVPSARALSNPNGTAPGWFVSRPDGRIIVALPGPPREMRPMWHDEALPLLRARGLGTDVAVRTYRLMGIGESQVADILGEELLRRDNPEVATYARADAVDVRVSAIGQPGAVGSPAMAAGELVEAAGRIVEDRLGGHIWAVGHATWSEAIGDRLGELGWRLAIVEIGTGGQLTALLGDVDWLAFGESIAPDAPPARAHGTSARDLLAYARRAAEIGGCEVGVAVRTRERKGDTVVSVAVATPAGEHLERRVAFLGGRQGRVRAALVGATVLLMTLRREGATDPDPRGEAARPGASRAT